MVRSRLLPYPDASRACVRGTHKAGAFSVCLTRATARVAPTESGCAASFPVGARLVLARIAHRDDVGIVPYEGNVSNRSSHSPDASLTCGWERKNGEADAETARLRGGRAERARSDAKRGNTAKKARGCGGRKRLMPETRRTEMCIAFPAGLLPTFERTWGAIHALHQSVALLKHRWHLKILQLHDPVQKKFCGLPTSKAKDATYQI